MKVKIDDIVRYGAGSSAIMMITRITTGEVYEVIGIQFYGGTIFKMLGDLSEASEEDKEAFKKQRLENYLKEALPMRDYFKDLSDWQDRTFPKKTCTSILNHLDEEIRELRVAAGFSTDQELGEEIADCVMLLIGYANHAKIDLNKALQYKLMKNKLRNWGEPNEKGYVKHINEDLKQ